MQADYEPDDDFFSFAVEPEVQKQVRAKSRSLNTLNINDHIRTKNQKQKTPKHIKPRPVTELMMRQVLKRNLLT